MRKEARKNLQVIVFLFFIQTFVTSIQDYSMRFSTSKENPYRKSPSKFAIIHRIRFPGIVSTYRGADACIGWHVLYDRRTVNEPQAESKRYLSLCSEAKRGVVCAVNFHPHTRSDATVRHETNDNQDVIKGGSHAATLSGLSRLGASG